jgi:hypothetical protein
MQEAMAIRKEAEEEAAELMAEMERKENEEEARLQAEEVRLCDPLRTSEHHRRGAPSSPRVHATIIHPSTPLLPCLGTLPTTLLAACVAAVKYARCGGGRPSKGGGHPNPSSNPFLIRRHPNLEIIQEAKAAKALLKKEKEKLKMDEKRKAGLLLTANQKAAQEKAIAFRKQLIKEGKLDEAELLAPSKKVRALGLCVVACRPGLMRKIRNQHQPAPISLFTLSPAPVYLEHTSSAKPLWRVGDAAGVCQEEKTGAES